MKQHAIVYIPVEECTAWKAELQDRGKRIGATRDPGERAEYSAALKEAVGDGSRVDMHDFLLIDPRDKGKRGVKYVEEL